MLKLTEIQYLSDVEGNPTGVLVPLALWQELISEQETAYLLNNPAMRQRLCEARQSTQGIPFEVVREKLGI
ncbi:MAG: prevent-host-death protein [Thiotrichaceae bacterium IS1]|nr:MAG: prevent-host-death protein [Thiotrichaceae bacterium IS1]